MLFAVTLFQQEFHTRFEGLLQRIPPSHQPKDDYLIHLYTRSFNGQLGYLLRDKNPQSIQEAQELATKIEGNLLSSKIEPFANPRGKIDVKQKRYTMLSLLRICARVLVSYKLQ
jgi:hypothetical protein